jgi:signal transduction histidine kinase
MASNQVRDSPAHGAEGMTPRAASLLAWSAVVLALALAVVGAVLSPSLTQPSDEDTLYSAAWWAIAVSWAIVGALVASRQPHNAIGWILCGLTLYAGLIALADGYFSRYVAGETSARGWADAAAWVSKSGSAWIPLVLVPFVFLPLLFPHGRLPQGRWRLVPWCGAVGIAAFWFSQAFAPGPLYDHRELTNPYGLDHWAVEPLGLGSVLVLAAVLAAVASLVVRFRRSTGVERQQIKWLAYAGCVAATALAVGSLVGGLWSEDLANALILIGVLGLTLAIGIAILRHRLYDIDLLINRTLVYGGLTAGVVAIYIAVVGGLSAVLHDRADFWLALAATGLVALLVQPLRSGLQRRVNRVMYGSSGEAPSGGLRERLHEAFAPEAAELQRARETLVAAREDERLRLRRDLHDGLGPTLAGAALKVEAAENLLASDPTAAGELLERSRAEIQVAVSDVRRLVYGLRPPALDELGLVGALREQGERLSVGSARIEVEVEAPETLTTLPAAVEVAAYRIALEAMTNAARHARAGTCRVALRVDGALELVISDDGDGLPDVFRAGVGIASMKERAEELGGTCSIRRTGRRGTTVHARLPAAAR